MIHMMIYIMTFIKNAHVFCPSTLKFSSLPWPLTCKFKRTLYLQMISCMWTSKIKIKTKPSHVIFLLRGNFKKIKLFYTDISQSRKGVTTTLYWFLTRQKYTTTFHCWTRIQANKYLLKSRIETLKNGVEKLTVKNLELYHWRRSCVFVVNFEYITYIIFQYIFFICWDLQIRFLFIKSVLLFFNRSLVRSYSHFKRIVTIKNVFFLYTFNKLWS